MSIENYYYPSGTKETEAKIQHAWDSLTNKSPGTATSIQVAQGRQMMIYKQAKKVCEVSFQEMCEMAKGSTDYMALA
jgi:predicted ATPase